MFQVQTIPSPLLAVLTEKIDNILEEEKKIDITLSLCNIGPTPATVALSASYVSVIVKNVNIRPAELLLIEG
jgi:hypothetical protein